MRPSPSWPARSRVDVPLRQHLEELYATHCVACRRPVVADQFIWPRDEEAPGRKIYRCTGCDAALGGAEERVAPVDDNDLAKLGLERPASDEQDLIDVTRSTSCRSPRPGLDDRSTDPDDEPLGEGGGPPPPPARPPTRRSGATDRPRFASTVRPDPVPVAAADGLRQSPQYVELRARFPVLDGRDELVEELLDLYTPRNLYALHAIGDPRSTPSCATTGPPRSCGWRSRPASCPRAG
jgi:hypothetical protein